MATQSSLNDRAYRVYCSAHMLTAHWKSGRNDSRKYVLDRIHTIALETPDMAASISASIAVALSGESQQVFLTALELHAANSID